MTVTPQRVSLSEAFTSCRLGRADLKRVTEIATDGLNAAGVEVSTEHNNVSYEAGNIDDLIDSVRASLNYDDRVPWTSFAIHGSDGHFPSDLSANRYVSIVVTKDSVRLLFAGADHIWVHGQLARTQLFLVNRNGKKESGLRTALLERFSVVEAFSTVAWLVILPVLLQCKSVTLLYLAVSLFPFLVVWHFFRLFVKVAERSTARGRISFTEDVPSGNIWQRMDLPNKILFLTLVVGAVAAVGTVVSAGVDLFGN
ncbi:hypothetical protein [Streptomyces mirabilis]